MVLLVHQALFVLVYGSHAEEYGISFPYNYGRTTVSEEGYLRLLASLDIVLAAFPGL